MRTFVVLIVLLNVGYFFWLQRVLPEDKIPAFEIKQPFKPAQKTLMLLGEQPAPVESILPRSTESMMPSQLSSIGINNDGQLPVSMESVPVVKPIQWCGMAGEFADELGALSFVTELGELGMKGNIEVLEKSVPSTWLVHLPPFKFESDARIVLEELHNKDIDSYFMRTGELMGGISLGVFSREINAQRAKTDLVRRGYQAEIKEIFLTEPHIFVYIQLPDATLRNTSIWDDFWAIKTKLEVTEKLCETIAR